MDTVEVSAGSTTQTFSGNSIYGYYNGDGDYIGSSTPAPVTATTITVKFTSDGGDTRTGFLAVVTGDVTVTTDVTGESGIGKCIIE